MTRTMYDAVTIANLPADAKMLAGYVDGRDTTGHYDRVRTAHPHALVIKITVTGETLDAEVGDIETGDMSPKSGAAWAARKIAAGQHPTLYCNASTWPAVKAEVQKAGIAGRVSYWIADYDRDPTIPAGAVAKQFTDHALGLSLDQSIVAAHWPGVDPDTTTPPHLTVVAENRGYATLTWTQTPGATSYDFYDNGVLVAIHTAGKHTTGKLHGEHTFRVLALGPSVRVWSNPVIMTFTDTAPAAPVLTVNHNRGYVSLVWTAAKGASYYVPLVDGKPMTPTHITSDRYAYRRKLSGRHTFRVAAVGHDGSSTSSRPVTVTLP